MVNMVDVGNDERVPEGADFKVTLAGREIWFRRLSEGQRVTLSRIQHRSQRQVTEVAESPQEHVDKIKAMQKIIDTMYQRIWDAIDSTMIFEDDRDFLEEAMLHGRLEMKDAMRVFREGRDEPEPDDAEPAVKPRKARPAKKAIPAKKTANAQRTQE